MTAKRKIFVVDTNVLIHDPTSILRFQEHDVVIPIVVLEELDNIKVGMSEIARNVRQVSRLLDELVEKANGDISHGIKLPSMSKDIETGHLFFHMEEARSPLPFGLSGRSSPRHGKDHHPRIAPPCSRSAALITRQRPRK